MNKKFSVGEFFCGPGGLGLGAQLAKIKDKNNFFDIQGGGHLWYTEELQTSDHSMEEQDRSAASTSCTKHL